LRKFRKERDKSSRGSLEGVITRGIEEVRKERDQSSKGSLEGVEIRGIEEV
jgi:hypothetical protein